jgi:hypothetical protein
LDNYLVEEFKDFIEDGNGSIRFKHGAGIPVLIPELNPSIDYSYAITCDYKYSFLNKEFKAVTSEIYTDLSDGEIYLLKIKEMCKRSIQTSITDTHYSEHIKTIDVCTSLIQMYQKGTNTEGIIRPESMPQFGQFGLYTNKDGNKAPRIFFFFGHLGVIHILGYDPFHNVFKRKSTS